MPAATEILPAVGEEKEVPAPPPAAKPIVGIIYPPPEVRNIVDKTASFVARNGPEFEARIRQNELNNPKFNFLNPGDPYHAYYQHKVKEFKEGKAQDTASLSVQQAKLPTAQQRQQEFLKQVEQPFVLKDPPVEFEFIADPPSISAFDLDVVKLTAQFVARNGRQFLTNLMTREQRNYQFDFLRPQHSLFQYFTKLLEQYTKVLIPPKDLMRKLREESQDMTIALDQVRYRAEWIKHEEIQKRKEEEEAEKERVAYAQIDWHDFVVVETVDYQSYEQGHFPPPTTPDEVGARVLLQERLEEGDEVEMQIESDDENEFAQETKDDTQVQDMEEESSEEEEDHPAPSGQGREEAPEAPSPAKDANQPSLAMPLADKVIIKKGYDPKAATRTQRGPAPDEYLISLITGEKIPASKVEEHMRIGLLDPRWVEQRDRQMQEKLNQESVYAPGSAIEASLKRLAERRTDIFGVGDEETAIGKKIGEEDKRKEEKVTWDGHTSSVEAATRAARANITLEDQIHQIHKVKGLLPDEEKEKIGPKPNPSRGGGGPSMMSANSVATSTSGLSQQNKMSSIQAQQSAQHGKISQGVTIKAAPVPQAIPPKPTISAPPVPAPPVGPPNMGGALGGPPGMHPMAGMPPGGLMAPQPGMMMVPPMPTHLRPPPMMAFPVSAPSAPPVGNFMPGPPNPGQMPPQPQPPMVSHMGEPLDDEPPSKKQRTEENLMPEADFLASHPSPVSFKVGVPQSSEKPDWKLNGQLITLILPLTDSVSVIKAKVHEETGMPPGKQKLQWEGLFFKDSNSLAYYNITQGGLIQLQVKERGGRKK